MDYIRWYDNGKFTDPEEIGGDFQLSTDYIPKIGDHVSSITDEVFFWAKDKWFSIQIDSDNSNTFYNQLVTHIEYVDNLDGYQGYIIVLDGHWPWFQSIYFKKINEK